MLAENSFSFRGNIQSQAKGIVVAITRNSAGRIRRARRS